MKLDLAQTLMITMATATLAIFIGFVLGYTWGRADGQFSQHCTDLGGRVLNDRTCGHEIITPIDAGTR